MSERNLWIRVRRHIGSAGHFERIENGVSTGTPDVSFCVGGVEGFIELKFVSGYPRRGGTRLLGERGLRKEQVAWAIQRCRAGGRVFALIGVGMDIYLVRLSEDNVRLINDWTPMDIAEQSTFFHCIADALPWPMLVDALTG